jgi:protocatechuate 4,5-dioxygenase beta chain
MDAGFDLAFSNELRIDHSITCPLITLRPQADLPIVPIYTNIFAHRFLGRSGSEPQLPASYPIHRTVRTRL